MEIIRDRLIGYEQIMVSSVKGQMFTIIANPDTARNKISSMFNLEIMFLPEMAKFDPKYSRKTMSSLQQTAPLYKLSHSHRLQPFQRPQNET